jgi:SHS2 domain-containing protein
LRKGFEIIEHTADIGIRAYGADIAEAFANAAKGMFSLITDLNKVQTTLSRDVEASAADQEILLVEWLNQLVYLFDVEHILFKDFDITTIVDTRIQARCYGEKVDKSRHELKIGIKSATYHMLKIEENPREPGYQIQVLFDI